MTPLVAPPFGRDTSATDRVRYGRIVSGPLLVAEYFYRLFTSPKGSLLDDDPAWGEALADKLGANYSQADVDALPGKIESIMLRDERVDSVAIVATMTNGPGVKRSVKVTIGAQLVDGGTFTLALGIADLTVELLDISAGISGGGS